MKVNAYAKINWSLDITGVRADGYHLMDMVMQCVSLKDEIVLEEAEDITFAAEGGIPVPQDDTNLALRAAKLLQDEAGIQRGVRIFLEKNIPSGAGMGGGSADAAAVLKGLNELWELHLSDKYLAELGLKLGADVPYCLYGHPARVSGIGEIISPIPCKSVFPLVIIQPGRGLSTKEIFAAADGQPLTGRPGSDFVEAGLASGRIADISAGMGNVFQSISVGKRPAIGAAISVLRNHGAKCAQMTGSGSAVFGVFSSGSAAAAAWEKLRMRYPKCYLATTLL